MIAVLQRVSRASVTVDGETVGSCGKGLCILLGVAQDDSERDAEALVEKIVNLRIFTDDQDKMNLSLLDVGGEMLVVSNFTLLAAYRKGKRPVCGFVKGYCAGVIETLLGAPVKLTCISCPMKSLFKSACKFEVTLNED